MTDHPGGEAFAALAYPPHAWHFLQAWGDGHCFALSWIASRNRTASGGYTSVSRARIGRHHIKTHAWLRWRSSATATPTPCSRRPIATSTFTSIAFTCGHSRKVTGACFLSSAPNCRRLEYRCEAQENPAAAPSTLHAMQKPGRGVARFRRPDQTTRISRALRMPQRPRASELPQRETAHPTEAGIRRKNGGDWRRGYPHLRV